MPSTSSNWILLVRDNVIARLVAYYVVVLGMFIGVLILFPEVGEMLDAERRRQMLGTLADSVEAWAPSGTLSFLQPDVMVPVGLGMLGAFLLALPVAWVYLWTREPKTYRTGFAQTLVVLPIAIALVVFLVKGSLALAFSLAGIVAAIRWRTSLNETMDAVFMFVIIGIGLAAGVQLLFVALLGSVVFNALTLAIWRVDFGAHSSTLVGWTLTPRGVPKTGAAPKPKLPVETAFDHTVRMTAENVNEALRVTGLILAAHAKEWRLARIDQAGERSTLEFAVRLKKKATMDEVIRALRASGGSDIHDVELVSKE